MATATIDYELQKVTRTLPGYDPFAQAGDCVFDEELAQYVIRFVETCCSHVKGELAGTRLILDLRGDSRRRLDVSGDMGEGEPESWRVGPS